MSIFPSFLKRSGLLVALVPAVFLAGCANMVTTAGPTNSFSSDGTMNGRVHGGTQGVTGASVLLYTAGTTGYGTQGTLLASTTTDKFGYFAFTQKTSGGPYANTGSTYICPSSTTQTYIIATGGNTQGSGTSTNSAAAFITALGACGSAGSASVDMNEVTTVGTMAALLQYFDPTTESFGYPATSTQGTLGFTNAVATIANLVTVTSGTAGGVNASATATPTGSTTAVTVNIAAETAKINTIANITAACVNQASSATSTGTAPNTTPTSCGTLFANVPAPSPTVTSHPSTTFPAATDVLQATYYMLANPSSGGPTNISNLFALQTGVGSPFVTALSAPPTDWTIAITYTTASTCNAAGGIFLAYAYDLGVDATGNVWLANGASAAASTNPSSTTQISPLGVPLVCSAATGASRGGATIDTAGDVWTASGFTATATAPSYVYRYDVSGVGGSTAGTTDSFPLSTTGAKAYAIRADGAGNVFITDSGGLKLYEIAANAAAGTAPTAIGAVTGSSPYSLAIDPKGTVIAGQSGSGGSTITAFALTTVGGTTYGAPQNLAQTGAYAGVYGIAFDSSDNFWVGNSAGTSSSAGTAPGNTTSATSVTYSTTTAGAAVTVTFGTPSNVTPIFAGGISTGRQVAIDGANNVWTTDNTAASSGLYAVSEISAAGAALSPTSTAAGTGTTVTNNGGFQKAANVLAGPRGIAVDPSGNVWVSNTAATTNDFITEIVGAAVPVVTPLSVATENSKLGTKP